MIIKNWLILAVALSSGFTARSLLADDQPPGGTNASELSAAPASSSKKKKAASVKKTPAAPKKSIVATEPLKATPVSPGPAVVTQKSVNIRGQAAINSEVIVRLQKGDHVNVVEEVTLKNPKADEPAKWAKVSLPTNAPVWVNASFINAADKTVTPKKLKVRSGPGENYSVLAIIPKGTVVKEVESKGDWMKIEAPAEACGFIAAHLLSNKTAAPPPTVVAAVDPPRQPPVETKLAPPITPAA